jgi:Leucine-rich repeat (LRR) protein
MTALRELDLSVSAVTSLRFVTNMAGLRRLAVPGNHIVVLPEGRYLQSLQYLDISCNPCVLLLLVVVCKRAGV